MEIRLASIVSARSCAGFERARKIAARQVRSAKQGNPDELLFINEVSKRVMTPLVDQQAN
jgi:hypothetical protein